jgi:hypothetical protein
MRSTVILLVVFLLLAACASGPITAPVAAGGAAMIAVFDQLLASGEVTPLQHMQLVQGITAIQATAEAAKQAGEGALTPETAGVAAGGLAASILGIVRLMRGKPTKTA